MLNAFNNSKDVQAVLHYGSPDYMILRAGAFVYCAFCGQKIELESLLYWSVEYQEPYINAQAMHARALKRRGV